ncbi:carbonic anhydrase [Streptomyces sp. RKAG337]|uniref:carbonic anhydrase n=1 Tax=Streptomyces sp. RKAG337 TaxID=2893404 RepID=UPI0020338AB0|nr:carbonic anhydrase [Streptomyces sp. RKAG337]MCM2430444.1 carbonic anhydrase [Streptomyces sp. RKAG337]
MRDIAEGVQRFQRDVFPARAALFEHLAATHRPTALFIGCSDARVVPELITQREPGELFVIRTAGNLVPAHAAGADGVAASIEYAIGVLGVSDIIVCGHSACGAMTALAEGRDLTALPAIADWLRHADASPAGTAPSGTAPADGGDAVAALIRDNVLTQLEHLATHPSVARALDRHTVTLHGWVYDIGTGAVEELDSASGRFTALAG